MSIAMKSEMKCKVFDVFLTVIFFAAATSEPSKLVFSMKSVADNI